jgi:cytochrome c-type biogenesis protein CcmH
MSGLSRHTRTGVPAKAGIHSSGAQFADRWVPAIAGTPVRRHCHGAAILRCILGFVLLVAAASAAYAVRPDEMLADPALEARAREVGSELRCLVCRNQSIDDSDAGLARDLRLLVRQRIAAGDSNNDVIAYVRSRYGDFVLLRPPLKIGTILLWGGPALILALGGLVVIRFYRSREPVALPPLNPDELQRLAAVLGAPPPYPPPLAGEGQGGSKRRDP